MRSMYEAGCRCDLCKQAESAYKRDLRRRQREAVGEFVTCTVPALSLVTGDAPTVSFATDACGAVEAAVSLEIEGLGNHRRSALAAACLALAQVLDNPKAVSTQPAAARQLVVMLGMLSRRSHRRGKLGVVKSMTADG